MKLISASNNKHKIYEIKKILSDKFDEVISLSEAGITHETIEDGTTFMENAVKKAREISELSGCPALADDSGICAHALDNAPGIYSARFSGGTDEDNNDLLLRMLEDKDDKGAHYTCAVAIAYPDGKLVTAEGYMYGTITKNRRGDRGFGYDPIFFCDEIGKTYAEASAEEKNAVSHRGRAVMKLADELAKRIID